MFINSFFSKDPLSFLNNHKNIKLHDSINDLDKTEWNSLIGNNNPFIEYEFFKALEVSKSVGKGTGWIPKYLCYYKDDKLVGAIPIYIKNNSYGEYIFDWSWASAYSQAGLKYYPKMTISVPFTPATGKRILINPEYNYLEIADDLVSTLIKLAQSLNVSSINWLFIEKEELEYLKSKGFMPRFTHQYHWKNKNYKTFDDFLEEFNSKKRNQLKRERRQANEGVKIEILEGDDIKQVHWDTMFELYLNTSDKKWGNPYLNKKFFDYVNQSFKDNAVMVLAKEGEEYIAGALNFKKGEHLYGRYWGAFKEHQCLHFEVCYYQSIDYAIKNNISLFEAGAQGEHKFYRGFLPEYTYSVHLILDERFTILIDDFLKREKKELDKVMQYYRDNSPFKSKVNQENVDL